MSFIFNRINSLDMGLRVANDFTKSHASRDVEFIEIAGRDGDVAMDNKRYTSVSQSIPVMLSDLNNVETQASNIANWLLTNVGYHNFTWSDEPNYVIKAIYTESFDLDVVLRTFGRTVLNFRFHPIKYLAETLELSAITSNTIINNPYKITAKPLIKITGNGDINLTIANSTPLVLRGVDGGIIVDCDTQTVTSLDGQRTQFDKMYSYPFPDIKPGNNLLTFTGATSVSIAKRLGALI